MTRLLAIRSEKDIETGINGLLGCDPAFGLVIDKAGPIPLRAAKPGYSGLASIIVAQMISKVAADSIWQRLEIGVGEVSPQAILAASMETLRGAGLSGAKEATLRGLALAVEGGLDLEAIAFKDPQAAIGELTAIHGVGLWTAEVYLLFCAGHCDIFPTGDVALQNAAAHAFSLAARPKGRAFKDMAERWAPWRSLAARALWAYYATEMRRKA